MIENFENIKKDTLLHTKQLGVITRAKSLESIKQGRGFKNILLVYCYGEDIGMFNEHGSVYVEDIVKVFDKDQEDNWNLYEGRDAKEISDI